MSKSRLLIILLLVTCILIWAGVWQKPHLLRVIFFDVGEGDAALILFPYGGSMLIDGGEQVQGERVILPYLRKKGIRRIDTVVLTHAHSDHVGGLVTILKALPVGLIVESGFPHTTDIYTEFLEEAYERNVPYKLVRRGQELTGFRGVRIEFLNPPHPFLEGGGSDINDNSVVIKLSYGRIRFLLCADIEREAEKELLKYGSKLRSHLIKVPHHGSESSSSWEFIKEVSPQTAIISVARGNRFGHPDSITLTKYERVGCEIYRTDIVGAIMISSDGKRYRIRSVLKNNS